MITIDGPTILNGLKNMQNVLNNSNQALAGLTVDAVSDSRHAKWMHERLVRLISDFEENMPDNMQAGGKLVSFQNTTFSIDDVSYWNPDIIIFDGTLLDPDGAKVQLVQHTSQLSLLLVAVPRSDTSKPRRKIGFEQDTQEEK